MAHQSRFLSVNLNKSYGKSSSSSPSSASAYGNGRPRSASGGGGMVVLSRPRSSSGASAHKPAPRLSVPPPVNLPSLRKEHERLDPASSKPLTGHGGSGMGPGYGSSMSWTKPTPPVPEPLTKDDVAKSLSTGEQRSVGGTYRSQVFTEKAVILKGEDFPSLLATSNYSSKQKQKPRSENYDDWAEKVEMSSAIDMRPQLRSKSNVHGSEGGISRVRNSAERDDGNFLAPLPLVKLRHTSDWDDDERDRNHGFSGVDHYDGRVLMNGEARSSFSRDSGRIDPYVKDFMTTRKEDSNANSWRVTAQPNRELSYSRLLHVDRDHVDPRNSSMQRETGKESSHHRLPYVERRDFGSGMGFRNIGVIEPSNERVEVSSNWQRGKPFANGKIPKGPISPRVKGFSMNNHVQSLTNEKLISNVGKPYAENASWGGKDTFSSDAMLDLNAKVFRKKKEPIKHTDVFDPVRESFEAELERVQRLQEQERQRAIEEQARILEFARREAEEREKIAREEEERRRLLEEESREALWRAEQEKTEAIRRAEEQKIAREEERRKILMEEERRKEGAWKKLLELEARIAKRQSEAAANDRMKERDSLRDSDLPEWEKSERLVENITDSPSFNSSSTNSSSEAGFKPPTASVENYSSVQWGKTENNWNNNNNNNNPVIKLQDQASGCPSARQDIFRSDRSFPRKQFQGIHEQKPVATSFTRGMSDDQTHNGQNWDRNRDTEQVNARSSIAAIFGGWDHGHFDENQLVTYSERSFQNNEVDDLGSFSRVRHTVRQPRVPPPPSFSSSSHKSPFRAASVGLSSSFSVDVDERSNQTVSYGESDNQILYGCSYHQRTLEPGTLELLEESTSSLLQTEEKSSPRYGSQSSLSVSNPPSSPTQLSHDEFDDREGSPALTTSVEEENLTFSEVKLMIPELDAGKIDAEMLPFSPTEDDEWAVEDTVEMLEEHKEGADSNQDDKSPESDAGVLEMKNKLEDLDEVVEKHTEMCDTSYTIDGCVQLGDSGIKMSTNQGLVSDSISDRVFANSSAGSLQLEETIPDKIMNASPEIAEITFEAHEGLFFDPVTNADHPTDSIRASKSSIQNPIAAVSRLPLPSITSLCSISTIAPTSSGQDDMPAKLQFGLFSSPPLIPSPLPTIQIGSIQMPLPLNAQIDAYAQMHHSHSPLFQFGQIRYPAPISQSMLPMGAQTMSFVHPPIARHHVDRKHGSSSNYQVKQGSVVAKSLDEGHPSFSAEVKPICAQEISRPSQTIINSVQPAALNNAPRDEVRLPHRQITAAVFDEKKALCKLVSGSENPDSNSNEYFRSMVHSRRARGRPHIVDSYYSARKYFTAPRAPLTMSEIKGNKLIYNVRTNGSVSSFLPSDTLYVNSNRPQRSRRHIQGTEYRVKENVGAMKMQSPDDFYYASHRLKPGFVGTPSRNVGRKGLVASKSAKLINEETAHSGSQVGAINNMNRGNKKEALKISLVSSGNFHCSVGNLSKSVLLEDDIDAPLRSGIVRVFNQPGVEASSDGDGFVEVRSKRKISNERRGQRERESNSKHKVMKVPRRHRADISSNGIVYKTKMFINSAGGSAAKGFHSDLIIAHERPSSDQESRLPFTSIAAQSIPTIGSPAVNCTDYDAKSNSLRFSQAGSDLVTANGVKVVPGLSFGNDIVSLDKASVPLGNWGTVHLNQTETASAQSQNDEPSNTEEFKQVSVAKVYPDDNSMLAVSSVATKEKPSFSSENLLNFPFDGEKIQFGAVTSPSPVPPLSQPVPSGIWPSGSVILNASIIHNLPMNSHSQSNFFDKEKFPSETCAHLDDTEAEAEAAASAIAVAAITNDEINVSKSCTVSISGVGIKALSGPGMTSCIGATGQSASEESLVVTLPADLSVDTPLPLWPPLPNLQSSRPVLSHIAGPQPSPFPFFDPSPMLGGGPIFAFRPQDESRGAQSQQQQSATFVSGPGGTWPQCHSSVDSFYGSPAGFPAPFISPSAGLSGVHGHTPMVFYNHFAPVGQFGQVGVSYVGNNYVPTGKKPDWKHSSEGTATVNMNKTDPNNLNNVYGQQNAAHPAAPIQHLSTGSAVMQVTSPFTMFNLRPFQSSPEVPVPAQWQPPAHHSSPHSIRLSMPPEQLQSLPLDSSGVKLNLPENHSASAADLPNEHGLVESTASRPTHAHDTSQPSRNHTAIIKDSNATSSPASRLSEDVRRNSFAPKPKDFERTTSAVHHHPLGPVGKAGSSLNAGSGGEWSRRSSFQRRHRGNNRSAGALKTKQIYVAKSFQTSSAPSS